MNKDKLVLKDETEIILESSNGVAALNVKTESKAQMIGLWEKFTNENLETVQIKNDEGEVTGIYYNMILDHVMASEQKEGIIAIVFSLREKSAVELLQEKVEQMEKGQKTQDLAIDDLGQAVSDIEGGV